MKEYRLSKNDMKHYSSIAELGEAYGIKQELKQTKDKNKLEKQRESFCKRHICRACGQPMTFLYGNVMVCKNEKCKGIKSEYTTSDGENKVTYSASYDLLDEHGSEIANNIFA